jgi:hypothetical protein
MAVKMNATNFLTAAGLVLAGAMADHFVLPAAQAATGSGWVPAGVIAGGSGTGPMVYFLDPSRSYVTACHLQQSSPSSPVALGCDATPAKLP